MKITPFIITLTGATSSGKSFLIEKIKEIAIEFRNNGINFSPASFPKFTTRKYRDNEIAELKKGKSCDVISVDEISSQCDLVYRTYGNEYGLMTKDLAKRLSQNECPIVIINDVRAVEELKKVFRGKVLSLFLFRHIANFDELQKSGKTRGNVSEKEVVERYIKATALYRIYIENITLFDRVILNVNDVEKDKYKCTELQIRNTLQGVFDKKILLNACHPKGKKLFILSGNATSGKDDVIRAIHRMGKLQADIISKYTSRRQEKDDGNEMICQFIPQQTLQGLQDPLTKFRNKQKEKDIFIKNDQYIDLEALQTISVSYNPRNDDERCYVAKRDKLEYLIYENHKKQVKYGFSINGLWQKMKHDAKHRVLVASFVNIFDYCKKKIGEGNVIPVFSYSQISKKTYNKQAKSEIERLKSLSYDDLIRYSQNIVDFSHVIIYAETQMQNESGGQKEELIDQMFRLFRAYD